MDFIGREAFRNERATGRTRDLGDIEALGGQAPLAGDAHRRHLESGASRGGHLALIRSQRSVMIDG